jgi:hypothetical protein
MEIFQRIPFRGAVIGATGVGGVGAGSTAWMEMDRRQSGRRNRDFIG